MNDDKAGKPGMHPEVKQVDVGPLCCYFVISQREQDRFRAEALKHEQCVLEEGATAGYAAPKLSIRTADRVSYLEFRGQCVTGSRSTCVWIESFTRSTGSELTTSLTSSMS